MFSWLKNKDIWWMIWKIIYRENVINKIPTWVTQYKTPEMRVFSSDFELLHFDQTHWIRIARSEFVLADMSLCMDKFVLWTARRDKSYDEPMKYSIVNGQIYCHNKRFDCIRFTPQENTNKSPWQILIDTVVMN
jgi:hypothetical protein